MPKNVRCRVGRSREYCIYQTTDDLIQPTKALLLEQFLTFLRHILYRIEVYTLSQLRLRPNLHQTDGIHLMLMTQNIYQPSHRYDMCALQTDQEDQNRTAWAHNGGKLRVYLGIDLENLVL